MGFLIDNPPSKKEFKSMRELLDDAEKYDNVDEKEIRDKILNILSDCIKEYINDDNRNSK